MAQHDYVVANGSGAVVRGDFNDALLAVATMNSSATAPSTTYAYMPYVNTSDGHLYQRNAANTAWIDHGTVASRLLRAEDIAAGGSGDLLREDGDGSGLTGISAVDQLSRDIGMVGVIEGNVGSGLRGPTVNYDFSSDSLSDSTGASHDAGRKSYSPDLSYGSNLSLTGTMTASSEGAGAAANANDNDTGTSWRTGNVASSWLRVQLAETKVIKKYELVSGGNDATSVTQIVFEGSNDGSSFTTIDTWSSPGWTNSATLSREVTNSATYLYYRWTFAMSPNAGPSVAEARVFDATLSNMTLEPDPVTLDTADPSDVQVYVPVLEGAGADAATNLLCAVSIDGSTFTTAEAAAKVYSFGENKLLRFDVATTGTGSSFIPKLTSQDNVDIEAFAPSCVPKYA